MDRSRQTIWVVAARDDSGPLGPAIPTLGHPTSASDLFRVVGLHRTGHEGWNSCYTDTTAPAALARLIEGPVRTPADLRAAEIALQALMWHERVDVLVPAFKARHGALSMYARETDPRSELAFQLFVPALAYDQIYAVEEVMVVNGTVASTSLEGSGVIRQKYETAVNGYLERTPFQAAALSSIPVHMGVPAYFANPLLRPFSGKRGFFGQFYTTVAREWDESVNVVPDVREVVSVPPLVAIVLDRAATRADLPSTIHTLRDELAPVRNEMLGFADMLRGALGQAEIDRRCKDIQASFAATFKASRAERASFLLPLLKLYRACKSPLVPLMRALNPDYQPNDPRVLVERTVTARTFAKLMKVDSMHSLLTNMLTPSEIRSLEVSTDATR